MGCSSSVPAVPPRGAAKQGSVPVVPSRAVAKKGSTLRNSNTSSTISTTDTLEKVREGPVLGRGFGDLVGGVHHIALIVADVGDALFFYTDIIGFQQIRRPNFDRHGAWLYLGNIQLHLIKGVPHTHRGQHPRDLIVSHIALTVDDIGAVLARLRMLKAERYPKLHWRQNVSVPTFEASSKEVFESDHSSSEGKLTQFFLEDPDGYWLEFCNCAEEDEHGEALHEQRMRELAANAKVQFRFPHAAKVAVLTLRWAGRARRRLACSEEAERELARLRPAEAADGEKLGRLRRRRNTYGDICQGFDDAQLQGALAQAGNDVPGAVLLLKRRRQGERGQVYEPPAFLDEEGRLARTLPFRMGTEGRRTVWM